MMSPVWSKPSRPTPGRGSVKRPASPKRGDGSLGMTARRRSPSPSITRSRPPSPRGPVRRNPSPSQLDPEQAEALRRRLGAARSVKLFLLQQSGSNSFLVAGEEPEQKYKVNIGPP